MDNLLAVTLLSEEGRCNGDLGEEMDEREKTLCVCELSDEADMDAEEICGIVGLRIRRGTGEALDGNGDAASYAATVTALWEEDGRGIGDPEGADELRFVNTGFLRREWKFTEEPLKRPTTPSQCP